MSLVIYACVALKWVLDKPSSDRAAALSDQDIVAPSLWLVEAANVLWRRCRPGKLTAGEAQDCLHELLNAPVAAASIQTDLPAAAHLAGQLHHLVNDCLYLAMAIRKDTYVVTADRRFYDVVAGAADLADRVRLL